MTSGIARSSFTISMRRSSNALRIVSTQSCGPVSAASAATCAMCVGFDVDWPWILAIALISG